MSEAEAKARLEQIRGSSSGPKPVAERDESGKFKIESEYDAADLGEYDEADFGEGFEL